MKKRTRTAQRVRTKGLKGRKRRKGLRDRKKITFTVLEGKIDLFLEDFSLAIFTQYPCGKILKKKTVFLLDNCKSYFLTIPKEAVANFTNARQAASGG